MAEILVSARTQGTSVPLKLYSYLLSGKPIVATDVPAHRELLNEDIAVLVMPTKEAFAQGILKLLRAPDLRERLGFRARMSAEAQHNYADYLAKVDRIYQTLQSSKLGGEQLAHSLNN
jgi:glycosyltransferase involved in cell wall biosynthesis